MKSKRGDDEHVGWSRDCVNLRLSRERAEKLRALARQLGPGATPTDAVDRALEVASEAESPATQADGEAAGAEEMLSALERLSERTRFEAVASAAAAADIARGLRELSELISAVAAASGGSEDGLDQPISLRAWLDSQPRATPGQAIAASARWQSKARVGDQHVSLELLVRRAACGDPRREQFAASSLVRLDRVQAASPFARTDLISAFLLSCQRAGDGSWRVAGHQMKPDGQAGPLLGTIRV